MIKWFKKLRRIVRDFDGELSVIKTANSSTRRHVDEAVKVIKERTDITTDLHLTDHAPNQIIVTGRYRNRDYVQVFTLADNELKTLVEQLREMQRYGVVSKIDGPYGLKAVVEKELVWGY